MKGITFETPINDRYFMNLTIPGLRLPTFELFQVGWPFVQRWNCFGW